MVTLQAKPKDPRFQDLTGKKYDRLRVVAFAGKRGRKLFWKCRCRCGTVKAINGERLRSGGTRSCGCLRKETAERLATKHGMAGTRTFRIWNGMKQRCLNENNESYKDYGGRGIKVCERWMKFENFLADMGEAPDEKTIERKDNDGDYRPGNCVWLEKSKQNRNRRGVRLLTHDGRTMCMEEWARELGIDGRLIGRRKSRGWSDSDALLLPKWPRTREGRS